MNKTSLPIIMIICLSIVSCMNNNEVSHKSDTHPDEKTSNALQANEDLLIGISKAVCYSGFRTGQHPDRGEGAINPTYEQILEDLHIISEDAGFNLIRVYDCGENSKMVLKVIKENNIDIKVLLGIWLRAEISNHNSCAWLTEPIPGETLKQNKNLNLEEIEEGISLANEYSDIILAVNVGNESLVDWNDHKVDVDTIIAYVQQVKQSIGQPVTVADNYKWWADKGFELAKVVDFLAIHIYPIWEGKIIDEALSYSIENVQEVRDSIPDAKIVITEAGWPTVASEFREQANEENQERYYSEFMSWAEEMNITTFWFEAFDEDWKGNPDNPVGAEKHWGLYKVDRKPKKVMQQFDKELN